MLQLFIVIWLISLLVSFIKKGKKEAQNAVEQQKEIDYTELLNQRATTCTYRIHYQGGRIETLKINRGTRADAIYLSHIKTNLEFESEKPHNVQVEKKNIVEELKSLTELHNCGALSDEEFTNAKKRILQNDNGRNDNENHGSVVEINNFPEEEKDPGK